MSIPASTISPTQFGPTGKAILPNCKDTPHDLTDTLFHFHLAQLSVEEKRSLVYWLLRELLGDRPQQETDICDPDGFLYVSLVPPGLREYFRLLEHPEREEHLRNASKEPTYSLQQIREKVEPIWSNDAPIKSRFSVGG